MRVEEHLELAFSAGFNEGYRLGKRDNYPDVDERWQRYKKLHFGADKLNWSFTDHLKVQREQNSQEGT